jgi:cytidylate kinase
MKKLITIAIDGFSSTGKSTLAKKLANKLGYVYVDTGAMYRAIALYAMNNELVENENIDKKGLIASLDRIELNFKYKAGLGFSEIYLNGENIESQIRSIEVSNLVSKVAAISEVRIKMVAQQHTMGLDQGIVMDGRDIGTVVFPKAELKLFMTASAEIRAQRRFEEMIEKGETVSYEAVLDNVITRDYLDTTRKDSPLVQAEDAIEIDSNTLNVEETFNLAYELAHQIIESS